MVVALNVLALPTVPRSPDSGKLPSPQGPSQEKDVAPQAQSESQGGHLLCPLPQPPLSAQTSGKGRHKAALLLVLGLRVPVPGLEGQTQA